MSAKKPPLLVGISGPSCSGKTTLAKALQSFVTNAIVIHQDEFYKPDSEIPVRNGVQDWDCAESLDISSLVSVLQRFKHSGEVDSKYVKKRDSQEEKASVLEKPEYETQYLGDRPVAIIEGFLLYSESVSAIRDMLDVKLFLRVDLYTIRARRGKRGYETIEGYWEDPPGYVDDIVWPNYVREHAFLFRDGIVEEGMHDETCDRLGIAYQPEETEGNMEKMIKWACETIQSGLMSG